jgi:chromosomal replication initiation ATPase DnaA
MLLDPKVVDAHLEDLILSQANPAVPFKLEAYKEYVESFDLIEHNGRYIRKMRIKDITSKDRYRSLVAVRYALIRKITQAYPKVSLKARGALFGGRDHTTILHAIKDFNDKLSIQDPLAVEAWDRLNKFLEGMSNG